MPRKLPWLSDKPDPGLAEARVKKRRLQSPDLPDELDALGASTPRRKGKARATRTPSSSPPPQPPKQEFMREGLAADDIWMMVEDEFLDTARAFTRHLHHAEYHRLKRAAREKNASAAQSIVQRVVSRGKMSVESQMMHEARAQAERQVETLRGIEGGNKGADELEEEAPWTRDPHLGGLMSGSQDSSSQLATLAGIKSKTRAAAGYAGSRLKPPPSRHSDPKPSKGIRPRSSLEGLAKEIRRAEANSDEDDLDAFSTRRRPVSKESVRRSPGPSTKSAAAREPSMLPPRLPRQSEDNSSSTTKQPTSVSSPKVRVGVSDRSTSTSRSSRDPSKTVTVPSTSTSTKSRKRKPLTSQFTFFDTFVGPDDPLDRVKDSNPENSSKRSPEQPAKPSAKEEKEQRGRESISADEIPTFLF